MQSRTHQQWREVFKQQANSDLSVAAFCKEHGIGQSYFYKRKSDLAVKDKTDRENQHIKKLNEELKIAKENGDEEAFVIGGGQIYKSSLDEDMLDKLYITYVHHSFEADVFFPEYDKSNWKKTSEIFHPKDEKHEFAFSFVTYEKK